MQVCKYVSMQICKYENMQAWNYASIQVDIKSLIKRKKRFIYILAFEIFKTHVLEREFSVRGDLHVCRVQTVFVVPKLLTSSIQLKQWQHVCFQQRKESSCTVVVPFLAIGVESMV